MSMLRIRGLTFAWASSLPAVLDIPKFDVTSGESVFLHGRSGSGKSTLLAAICGVVNVAPGMIEVSGTDMGQLSGAACDRFRGEHLGVIFQLFNLVPYLSALENVLLPCRFSERRRERAGANESGGPEPEARRLLVALGLGDPATIGARASELSVGQQQRVAAARALIGAPKLILADEPTSALDADIKGEFIELLASECRDSASALLFVSHDLSLKPHFDRTVDFAALNQAHSPMVGNA